ncbi:MAG: hypothetical protein Tsb0026_12670 [Sulfuricaulis sp.]
MTNLKCLSDARCLRALWIAIPLIAVCGLGSGPALADDTSLDDSAKKTGNNFGELLKGMGQELKKAGGSRSESGKKSDKKEKKAPENESGKDKDRGNTK